MSQSYCPQLFGAIDLRALVNSLLKRAAELPAKFVDELHHLRENLSSFFSDTDRLLRLGSRMLTIITLVATKLNGCRWSMGTTREC